MRLLFISPIFPPIADSEAFCGGKLVQSLIDLGHDPEVIFCSNTRLPIRNDASGCWHSLEDVSVDVPTDPRRSLISKGRTALRYQTLGWGGWVDAAVAKARMLHTQKPFDVIVSRSLPWHAHIAGYWIAEHLSLPWVASNNDPWDLGPFSSDDSHDSFVDPINMRFWHSRLLKKADGLVFPSSRLRDYFVHKPYPRAHVVPHIGTTAGSCAISAQFTIVHAGKLGVGDMTGRSIRPVLEAFRQFLAQRPAARESSFLEFVGALDPDAIELAQKLGVGDRVRVVGTVSYETSLKHIAQAAVCLLVEGTFKEGIFLPSKLCDYIAARKPIIAFSPDIGTVNDLTVKGGIYRISQSDITGAASVMAQMFDAFAENRLSDLAPSEAQSSNFTSENVAREFLEAVRSAKEVFDRGRTVPKPSVKQFALTESSR